MLKITAEREGSKYVIRGYINGERKYKRTVAAPLDESDQNLQEKIESAKRGILAEFNGE